MVNNLPEYNRKIRLLPVTIASLCLLFVAKIYDIYETGNQFSQIFLSAPAIAQEESSEKVDKSKKSEPKVEDKKDDNEKGSTENPTKKTDKKSPETLEVGKSEKSEDIDEAIKEKREFSEIEVDILQSLSKRRAEIETMADEVRMKESLLESTEVRLDEKISQIKKLEKTVRELLTVYDKEEEAKIASLVKIYENMKPKEAARIFDELEMSILLMVVDRMNERKVGPILAKMNPLKAKVLTEELAEDRKLRTQQEQTLNQIAPPNQPQQSVPAPANNPQTKP
jgi:flagellar motility protein MotE (MotC chaperone)